MTSYKIQWKARFALTLCVKRDDVCEWTDVGGAEEFANPHHAEGRLDYWRKLSFAYLMEFRVAPPEQP